MIILIQKTQRIGVVGFELQKTTLIMNSLIFNYYSILYNANRNSINVYWENSKRSI
jgi:hypothetical protein